MNENSNGSTIPAKPNFEEEGEMPPIKTDSERISEVEYQQRQQASNIDLLISSIHFLVRKEPNAPKELLRKFKLWEEQRAEEMELRRTLSEEDTNPGVRRM